MKKYCACIIVLASCLFAGGCISSQSSAPDSPVEFKPLVMEAAIPFDREDPESARFEISLALSEPADSASAAGKLVRESLYEGKSAADYGKAVIAEQEEFYNDLRAEWTSLWDAPADSFNWYYSEEVEGRTVSVKGLIPGRENLLVLTKTVDSYLGGAHGNSVTSYFVIDTAAAKRLTLDDIFSSRKELRLMLETELRRQYQLPENAPLSDAGFFNDAINLPENFSPADDEAGDGSTVMRFLWNTYEIAPYVMGAIEVSLPVGELTPLFRK
jgi:hypothetical protein